VVLQQVTADGVFVIDKQPERALHQHWTPPGKNFKEKGHDCRAAAAAAAAAATTTHQAAGLKVVPLACLIYDPINDGVTQ
jgi:hypothetical protein